MCAIALQRERGRLTGAGGGKDVWSLIDSRVEAKERIVGYEQSADVVLKKYSLYWISERSCHPNTIQSRCQSLDLPSTNTTGISAIRPRILSRNAAGCTILERPQIWSTVCLEQMDLQTLRRGVVALLSLNDSEGISSNATQKCPQSSDLRRREMHNCREECFPLDSRWEIRFEIWERKLIFTRPTLGGSFCCARDLRDAFDPLCLYLRVVCSGRA